MRRRDTLIGLAVVIAGAGVGGCSKSSPSDRQDKPAVRLERVPDTPLTRVILTPAADQRLGIATAPAKVVSGGRVAIPYAAVLYDPDGRTTTFTRPASLTYLRRPIVIEGVRGERAILRSGISGGDTVVVVGADELLGAETGIEGE